MPLLWVRGQGEPLVPSLVHRHVYLLNPHVEVLLHPGALVTAGQDWGLLSEGVECLPMFQIRLDWTRRGNKQPYSEW